MVLHVEGNMSYPFGNVRVKSLFGSPPEQKPRMDNPILDEFFTKILPLIRAGRLEEENRARIGATRESMFGGQERPEEVIDLTRAVPKREPLNVRFDPMINPYQQGLLQLRQRELEERARRTDITSELQQQKNDIYKFKAENPTLKFMDNRQGQMLVLNPLTGEVVQSFDSGSLSEEDKIALQQRGALERIAATGRERMSQIERGGELTAEQIAQRAEEQRKTEAARPKTEKPEPASVTRTNAQVRYNRVINQHPEWRDYIQINEDTKLPQLTDKAQKLDPKERAQIMRELGLSEGKDIELPTETPVEDEKPPKGAKPGGRWVVTKSGRKVYLEPN